MVTFTINIPQMSAYIPYMDPMGMITMFVWHDLIQQCNSFQKPLVFSIQKSQFQDLPAPTPIYPTCLWVVSLPTWDIALTWAASGTAKTTNISGYPPTSFNSLRHCTWPSPSMIYPYCEMLFFQYLWDEILQLEDGRTESQCQQWRSKMSMSTGGFQLGKWGYPYK